jgi:hypothetical protein
MTTHVQRNEKLKPLEAQGSKYLHDVIQETLYEYHLYVLQD